MSDNVIEVGKFRLQARGMFDTFWADHRFGLYMDAEPNWFCVFFYTRQSGIKGFGKTPEEAVEQCLQSAKVMIEELSKLLTSSPM